MLDELKQAVCRANLDLVKHHLITLTWGNASGIDRQRGLVVIKASGVPYDAMTPADMAVVDLTGNPAEGTLRPSSDTPTHLVLYRAWPDVGGSSTRTAPTPPRSPRPAGRFRVWGQPTPTSSAARCR